MSYETNDVCCIGSVQCSVFELWGIDLPSAEVEHLFRESNLDTGSRHPLRSCVRGTGDQHPQDLTHVLQ